MDALHDAAERIRIMITVPRRLESLSASPKWDQLLSALDVLEDTDLAIQSYKGVFADTDLGGKYLAVYGLLQAMTVQQDAAKNLGDALAIRFDSSESLRKIRDDRIRSIGHPTRRDRYVRTPTFHYIVRLSLKQDGFDLLTAYEDGRFESTHISTDQLIRSQAQEIYAYLERVAGSLEEEEMAHRAKHKGKNLLKSMPGIAYMAQVVHTSAAGSDPRGRGPVEAHTIREQLGRLESLLSERDELRDSEDTFTRLKRSIENCLTRLEASLSGNTSAGWNELDADTYGWHLRHQVEELTYYLSVKM